MMINAILLSVLSRCIGGGFGDKYTEKLGHTVSFLLVAIVISFNYMGNYLMFLPMLTAFWVIRMLPTQALFSAIHGQAPARGDGRWQMLQDWTFKLWRTLPEKYQSWRVWGIIYGAVRCSLLIPLAVVNPWLLIFLGLGFVYYAAGWVSARFNLGDKAVMLAEVTIGALFGVIL